ncbi:hypothetical protein GLOIN_2v1875584 [Rhizophagus irregularis DAOM 181602=DAOM 197198]|nr:hypothetical protein GLOIN_2v1875584 [Rhizophagus irregularis DAOM 181602=DAOM 197198]
MILEESFQESKTIEYAGRNGTLLIFDWTNPDRNLKIKHLNDLEEWKSTIKRNQAKLYRLKGPGLSNDGRKCFIRLFEDYFKVGSNLTKSNIYRGEPVKRWICLADVGKPRPPRYRADILEEIVQVVGKTNSAVNAFTERLFAALTEEQYKELKNLLSNATTCKVKECSRLLFHL